MHMSMGGLNEVTAVFMFSPPEPAYNKVEIFPYPCYHLHPNGCLSSFVALQ